MKQHQHTDVDAMLRSLPSDAEQALGGLTATPFLKARIDRAVQENHPRKVRFVLPRWVPAVCCAAVVLVAVLLFQPLTPAQPDPLITSDTMGNPTAAPTGLLTADLESGSALISSSSSKPGYRSIWTAVKDGSFPLIGMNGKFYRMLTSPNAVDSALLGESIGTIAEFTTEPSLSGANAIMSNVAGFNSPVYTIKGVHENTLIAAEVNGRTRLFQRVSFNGNALRGKESLADTLAVSGRVVAMELSSVGTVTDPAACEALMATLLSAASYESSGSISSKQALLIELDNGLVVQMAVKGEHLAACGVWSCPEFFESFSLYCE